MMDAEDRGALPRRILGWALVFHFFPLLIAATGGWHGYMMGWVINLVILGLAVFMWLVYHLTE